MVESSDSVVSGGGGDGGGVKKVILGKYELGRVLGQGSFSKVHYGRDLNSGESVAIKVIGKDQIRRDPNLAGQIRREISALRLARHPHVIDLKEVMATRSRIFVVMEYARGGELFARLAVRGRFPEPEARLYFRQLISAVEFCHSRGVFHRDLKPENLLLAENGDLKVSDFGLSAVQDGARAADGLLHTQCGTPAYVAPEILRRRGYDGGKADLWSCGIVLYALLAGFLPFRHDNLMQMYHKVLKAEFEFPPWFSPDARRLLSRLLVADPEQRISIQCIKQHPWFKKGLSALPPPPAPLAIPPPVSAEGEEKGESPRPCNAFELISAMSSGFDLSGLFEGRVRAAGVFTSLRPAEEILAALEAAGRSLGFEVGRGKEGGYVVRMERGRLSVVAEVFEAATGVSVVEFSKAAGDQTEYAKFCEEEARPELKDVVWTWQGDER